MSLSWPNAPFTGAPWTDEPTGPDVAFMIRTTGPGLIGHSGFQWPWRGYVCPRWSPETQTHDGIYGLLDGIGDWQQLREVPGSYFQIVAVHRSECRPDPNGSSIRAPRGWVLYTGAAPGAMKFLVPILLRSPEWERARCGDAIDSDATVRRADYGHPTSSFLKGIVPSDGHVVATGSNGAAITVGHSRTAVTTRGGKAQSFGPWGIAVAAHGGRATVSSRAGIAVALNNRGLNDPRGENPRNEAEAGDGGIAVSIGPQGFAKAGENGFIVLSSGDPCREVVVLRVGEGGILPDTWYTLENGVPVAYGDPSESPRTFRVLDGAR